MRPYLKEESFYSDLYDVRTIEECLRFIKSCRDKDVKESSEGNATKEQVAQAMNLGLYFIKGDRYRKKAGFIQELMSRDRARDEMVRDAVEPAGMRCSRCSAPLKVMFRQLYEKGGASRVLFLYECEKCEKRKGVFENGEEFKSEPDFCPKCKKEIKTSCSDEGDKFLWIKACAFCGFTETEVDDLAKSRVEREARQREESELLRKHRAEFCLSPVEGEAYLQELRNLEELKRIVEQSEKRQTDPDYKKAEQLKKLTVFELEKNLCEAVEKERYQKLSFEKPEIGRHIIIPFSVLDSDSSRKEEESIRKLQRLIKKALSETNWRLMSEGIAYKLGYLSGRLKGFEEEEDLVLLLKQKNKIIHM